MNIKKKWPKKDSLIKKLFGDVGYEDQEEDQTTEDPNYEYEDDDNDQWDDDGQNTDDDSKDMRVSSERLPQLDLLDKGLEYELIASVPGLKSGEVDVDIETNKITIRIVSNKESKIIEGDFITREIYRGESTRTIPLPEEVDTESSQATLKDGILKVNVKKFNKKKRSKVAIKKVT